MPAGSAARSTPSCRSAPRSSSTEGADRRQHGDTVRRAEATRPTGAVDRAHAAVGPDTIAKFLLTSGSTGNPKAVINTQRMLCANLQMIVQTLPALLRSAAGARRLAALESHLRRQPQLRSGIYGGGTLYIDDGKPVPGLIEKTVRNLREIAPTVYFNVPRGFEELVPISGANRRCARSSSAGSGMLFYAGAGLSQPVWDAMDELAVQACGERILRVTGLGATETAPSRHVHPRRRRALGG